MSLKFRVYDLTSSMRKSSGAIPSDRSPCTPACLPLRKCAIAAGVAHQGGSRLGPRIAATPPEYLSFEKPLSSVSVFEV
jgi:hypothetical protein